MKLDLCVSHNYTQRDFLLLLLLLKQNETHYENVHDKTFMTKLQQVNKIVIKMLNKHES